MTAPGSGPGSPGGYGQQPGGSQPGGFGEQPPSQPPGGYRQPAPGGQPGYGQQAGGPPAYGGGQQPPYGQGQYPGAPSRAGGSGVAFDPKALSLADWLTAGGSLLVFIFSFFNFAVPDIDAICDGVPAESRAACEASYATADLGGANAWQSGLLSFGVILLLLVTIAIAAKALKLIPASFPLHFVIAGIVLLVDIFFLIEFIDLLSTDGAAVGIGGWLALAALLAVNVGVVMSFLAAGGAKSLQGGISKLQQNAAQSGSHQGQQPPGGYGQPSGQAPGGYGQPGQQPPGQQPPGGYGQPGGQAPGGYGQSPSTGATGSTPSPGQSSAPGSGSSPAPPPPYGSNPPAGGSGGPTQP